MSIAFGRLQYLSSDRMRKFPFWGQVFHKVFGYTNVGNYARSRVFMRILEQLSFENWTNILDLGCGYGEYSVLMADLVPNARITALDIDAERCTNVQAMLKKAHLDDRINVINQKIETTNAWPQFRC